MKECRSSKIQQAFCKSYLSLHYCKMTVDKSTKKEKVKYYITEYELGIQYSTVQ